MSDDRMAALRAALEQDDALRARFEAAQTADEVVLIAADAGIDLASSDLADGADVSDAELAGASGGYTFPPTDWIYCDNPWTNAWCTLKC